MTARSTLDARAVAPRLRDRDSVRTCSYSCCGDDALVACSGAAAGLVGRGLLEARLGLAELRLEDVAPHRGERLVASDAVAEVGLDRHHLALDLARQSACSLA